MDTNHNHILQHNSVWKLKEWFKNPSTHRHDTVSSTLVAGIEAVKGSKSPINAMFIKLLVVDIFLYPVLNRQHGDENTNLGRRGKRLETAASVPQQRASYMCAGPSRGSSPSTLNGSPCQFKGREEQEEATV